MKVALLTLTLVGCMLPCLLTAQPIRDCAACVGAAGCNTTHEACVAECRARLFSIDPRRSDCITDCSNNAQFNARGSRTVPAARETCAISQPMNWPQLQRQRFPGCHSHRHPAYPRFRLSMRQTHSAGFTSTLPTSRSPDWWRRYPSFRPLCRCQSPRWASYRTSARL